MFEIVDDAFAIEEVHCGRQEVPVQGLSQRKILRFSGYGRDCNDFFEGDDLDSGHHGDDVNVTCKHGGEEGCYHYQRPYCACDEGLLFLFVL